MRNASIAVRNCRRLTVEWKLEVCRASFSYLKLVEVQADLEAGSSHNRDGYCHKHTAGLLLKKTPRF